MLDLLHRDADWCASVAPKEIVEESRGPDPQREAVWTQSPGAAQDARRREIEQIMDAARREFGHEPSEVELESFLRARAAGEV